MNAKIKCAVLNTHLLLEYLRRPWLALQLALQGLQWFGFKLGQQRDTTQSCVNRIVAVLPRRVPVYTFVLNVASNGFDLADSTGAGAMPCACRYVSLNSSASIVRAPLGWEIRGWLKLMSGTHNEKCTIRCDHSILSSGLLMSSSSSETILPTGSPRLIYSKDKI